MLDAPDPQPQSYPRSDAFGGVRYEAQERARSGHSVHVLVVCLNNAIAAIQISIHTIGFGDLTAPGLIGITNVPAAITVAKSPDTVWLVMQMPSARMMTDIVGAVQ